MIFLKKISFLAPLYSEDTVGRLAWHKRAMGMNLERIELFLKNQKTLKIKGILPF